MGHGHSINGCAFRSFGLARCLQAGPCPFRPVCWSVLAPVSFDTLPFTPFSFLHPLLPIWALPCQIGTPIPFLLHSHRLCHIGTPGCESVPSHLIVDPALPYRHTWDHSFDFLPPPPFHLLTPPSIRDWLCHIGTPSPCHSPTHLGPSLPYWHTQSLPLICARTGLVI